MNLKHFMDKEKNTVPNKNNNEFRQFAVEDIADLRGKQHLKVRNNIN